MKRRAKGAIRAIFVCLLFLTDGLDAATQSTTPRLFQPWMPDWERTDILEIKKASQPKTWLEALLAQVVKSPGENKLMSREAVSEQVVLLRLLQEFLAGYKEEGLHAQLLQPVGGLLIRWPVPVDQTGRLHRVFCDRLESARREVDQIFLERLRMHPYRGRLPVWIRYNEGETVGDRKRRNAGSTFGGALITLNLPRREPEQAGDPDRWTVPEQDIRELVDTAKHEFVHFYINRMLGEEKANRLPRDFHEGCATSLINSSTIEHSEIRVTVTQDGTMVRWHTMVSAPEDYQRYHLQMKYLRLAYGDALFFDFLRSVLSGADLNASVNKFFGKGTWPELFPRDLSVSIVDRFVLGKSMWLFPAIFVGLALPIAFWRRAKPWALWRAFRSLFQRDPFARLARAKLPTPGKKHPVIWLLIALVMIAIIGDRYLQWTNRLDIDSPVVLLQKALSIDLWMVALVVLAFLAVGAVRSIFFNGLKKAATHIFAQSENANTDNGALVLQKLRQVNTVLHRLKGSKPLVRESRDFKDLQTRCRNTEDAVRMRIARDLHSRVEDLLERHDCETACLMCSRLAPEMAGQAPFQDALVALSKHILQKLIEMPCDSDWQARAGNLPGMLKDVVRLTQSDERVRIARELVSGVEKLLEQHDCRAACLVCSLLVLEMTGQAPFRDALAALSRHILHQLVEMPRDPGWQAKASDLLGMLKGVVRLTQSNERGKIARELHDWVARQLERRDYEAALLACSFLATEMKGQVLFQDSMVALSQCIARKLVEAPPDPGSQEEMDKLRNMLRNIFPQVALRTD